MNRPPRTLRLIDVENMAGAGRIDEALVLTTQVLIEQVMPRNPGDHEVIAVSGTTNALAAFLAWHGSVQRRLGIGPDGADRALLAEVADVEHVRARYDRVVLASGDHLFAPAIASLHTAGVDVVVIAPIGSTARAITEAIDADRLRPMRTPIDLAARVALAA